MSGGQNKNDKVELHQRTQVVRSGLECDETGAVVPPMHLTSTFAFHGFGQKRTYDYTRSGNPTRDLLAVRAGGAGRGRRAVVTSTGMSAITLVGYLIPAGSRIVAPHDCYGGTYRLFNAWNQRGERKVDFVNFNDEAAVREALAEAGRAAVDRDAEQPTPAHHRMSRRSRRWVKAAGALVVVDNTFLSPAWQQPLKLGADLVLHSTTKYLNGHSDVVGGAVVAKDKALHDQLIWWANCLGITGAPFDSFLTLRGLRTLHVRLDAHGRNALGLAQWLQHQSIVKKVYYPGLPTHPGHDVARRQQTGFGAIVTLEIDGGRDGVRAFVDGLQCFSLAESLGGVEKPRCASCDDDPCCDGSGVAQRAGWAVRRLASVVGWH